MALTKPTVVAVPPNERIYSERYGQARESDMLQRTLLTVRTRTFPFMIDLKLSCALKTSRSPEFH